MMMRLTSLTNARVESAVSMATAPPIPPLPILSSLASGSPRCCLPVPPALVRRADAEQQQRGAAVAGGENRCWGALGFIKKWPRRVAPSASLTGHTCGEAGRAPPGPLDRLRRAGPVAARDRPPAEPAPRRGSSHHVWRGLWNWAGSLPKNIVDPGGGDIGGQGRWLRCVAASRAFDPSAGRPVRG
jgi:hypothetical protein